MDLIFKMIEGGLLGGALLAGACVLWAGTIVFEMFSEVRQVSLGHLSPVGSPGRPDVRNGAFRAGIPIPVMSEEYGRLRGRLPCSRSHFPCLVRE